MSRRPPLLLPLLAGLALAPAFVAAAAPRGHLVLIGGGEKPRAAMAKFVELAGGPEAPLVVIPTASSEADAGQSYLDLFTKEHGCTAVTVLGIKTREDAERSDYAAGAARARGIFFTGGVQDRITTALLGTATGEAIASAFENGAVVGGHSAGTACQSALMITGEGDFTVVRAGAVELKPGLGFLRGAIVDQHFIARQRSNRLLAVILEHPDLLGVGVDEDTAIWVRPDDTFEVIGASSVVVVDAHGAAVSRHLVEGGKDTLGVHDLRVHVLLAGERFDLARRAVIPPGTPAPTAAGR